MDTNAGFHALLQQITRTTHDLWIKGWAERNAGNISVRLVPDQMPGSLDESPEWVDCGFDAPELGGEYFLFSGTGCYMRNVELHPECDLGVVELDGAGRRFRRVWGFTCGGRPTSEIAPHLRAHGARLHASGGADRVVMHAHTPCVIALTHCLDLDTARLTRLLWEMHTECIVVFPEGCGYIPWQLPGSLALGDATARELRKRPMAVWQFHGTVGTGPDIDTVLGLMDTAEKAAQLYTLAAAAGGVRNKLSTEQLTTLARAFHVTPDPDILGGSQS